MMISTLNIPLTLTIITFTLTAVLSRTPRARTESLPDLGVASSGEFEAQQASWNVVFFVMRLLGQLLCLATNGTIVMVILRTSHLRTVSLMLVLALAFSDLVLAILWNVFRLGSEGFDADTVANSSSHPMVTTAGGASVLGGKANRTSSEMGVMGESPHLCNVVGFLWQTLLASSTLYQALVACDRYLFIVHPLRYEAFITRDKALVALLLLAFLALALPTATLLSGGSYHYLPAAGTCVSDISWYVLFILLVYLPSLAVTLLSNLGIWSLCVRQLNTPGRARLVREVPPHTDAFNLLKENGRVAVHRDIVDDFSCCIPALCRNSACAEEDSTACLNHLVQNTSLMFVEGFIAAVPASPENPSSPGYCQNIVGPNFVCPPSTKVFPPSPSPSQHAKNGQYTPTKDEDGPKKNGCDPQKNRHDATKSSADPRKNSSDPQQKCTADLKKTGSDSQKCATDPQKNSSDTCKDGSNGYPKPEGGDQTTTDQSTGKNRKLDPKRLTVRALSDPQTQEKPLTPRTIHKPLTALSSPSSLSSRSSRGHRFRKTPSSFLLNHDLADSLSSKTGSAGEGQPEEGSRLLSHGVCSILKTSPALSLEALEMLEFSMQHIGGRNLQVKGLSTSSYSSTTSLRSMMSDTPGFFRCPSNVSAISVNAATTTSEPVGSTCSAAAAATATTKADKAQVLSSVVNSIFHWMIPSLRLDVQKPVSADVEGKKEEEEEGGEHECGVIAERRAPLRRRAKAAVLVALPVVSLFLTVLPLVGVQILWVAGVSVSGGVTAWICHVMYFVIPSLNPFLIGLTNRHLRHAICDTLCCRLN